MFIYHLQTNVIKVSIQCGFDRQPGCCGVPNEVDADGAADEGSPTPIAGDMVEQPMVNRGPRAGAGRHTAHRDAQADASGKFLHRHLPRPRAAPMAPAGIRRDQEALRLGIHLSPPLLLPAADRFRGTIGGVVINAHTHPARMVGWLEGSHPGPDRGTRQPRRLGNCGYPSTGQGQRFTRNLLPAHPLVHQRSETFVFGMNSLDHGWLDHTRSRPYTNNHVTSREVAP